MLEKEDRFLMVRRGEDRETSMLGYVIFGTQERRHCAGKRERGRTWTVGKEGREREKERERERERWASAKKTRVWKFEGKVGRKREFYRK